MPRFFVHLWIDDRRCSDLKTAGHAYIQDALRDAADLVADTLADDLAEADVAGWEVRITDRAGQAIVTLSVAHLLRHGRSVPA